MKPEVIKLTLKSAATFGRGDGVAGVVDREIEHDADGFPFLRGKTLKGLLAESAANVVFALTADNESSDWYKARGRLFGRPGRGVEERGILHIGDAVLPAPLYRAVMDQKWEKEDVLYSLTGIRRQTSINEHGAPEYATLRSMRVLLPGVTLEAPLSFDTDPDPMDLYLLAAAVLDLRHAGTGRNRGRGWLKAEVDSDAATRVWFDKFSEVIG
jgi:hypothetical protein